MKFRIVIGFCLLLPLIAFPQGEWNNWIFGHHAGITFNSGSPVPITNVSPLFDPSTSSVTVSDSLGNLLFYAENNQSEWVYNRNNVRMSNGNLCNNNLQNNPQPLFAVKNLTDDSLYYIFSMVDPSPSGAGGLFYSVLDMRLDGGLGDIVPSQHFVPILSGNHARSVMTGTRHQNNKDVWIVVHNLIGSNVYLSYLVNSTGINTTPVVSASFVTLVDTNWQTLSSIKISPDGTKLVCLADTDAEYCSFNKSTGEITHLFKIIFHQGQTPAQQFYNNDAEFSIDNKYLYITEGGGTVTSYLYQFDATKTDSLAFKQSQILISSELVAWNQWFYCLQRGPDYKIYSIPKLWIDSISVINNPSLQGTACDFQKNAICLLPSNNAWYGFPQFLQKYYLYMTHSGQCQGDSINFSYIIWPPADSIHWDFGDPASGPSNFSNLPDPSHIYTNTGTYTVELFVRHIDNRTDTTWQVITILASPQPDLGPDQTICIDNSVTFDAGACTGCAFQWSNLTPGEPDIGDAQTYTTGEDGEYMVTVTSPNGCIGRDTIQLFTTHAPSVTNNPLSKSICSGESTGIQLTSDFPNTVFHWTATLTSGDITGFSADSGTVINQFLVNSGTVPGIVTYSITPKIGSCTGATVYFPVTVNPDSPVSVSISTLTNPSCLGVPVTFTSIAVNSGSSPSYQWKVNGNNAGFDSPVFTYAPFNADVVQCILTSSNTECTSNNPATSNPVTMTISPLLPVSISIAASDNPFCLGQSVTLTATPLNPGLSPTYEWIINSTSVFTTVPVYIYQPAADNIVSCILTSSEICTTGNPATSNTVMLNANQSLPAGISITASANPVCSGLQVTYTAIPVNGGSNPVFKWKVNGLTVGGNGNTYSYIPLSGDKIRCELTSNLNCVTGNPAVSNEIAMAFLPGPPVSFSACMDTITTTQGKPFRLKGGLPLGGTYSGPGVNSVTAMFDPMAAGAGVKVITYSYMNAALCSNQKSRSIYVQAPPAFNCQGNLRDVRDNQLYPTFSLPGGKCWMAMNLNYGTFIQGNEHQTDNCQVEKYCSNNQQSQCQTYGGFYQWDELMRFSEAVSPQGLCPAGWHIPSNAEWDEMLSYNKGAALAGGPLQDITLINNFQALLGGIFYMNSIWSFILPPVTGSMYWTSTTVDDQHATARGLNAMTTSVTFYQASKANAFAVRCVRD